MNKNLSFHNNSSNLSLSFNRETINFYGQEKVNLLLTINNEIYQQIDKQELFNLKSEIRKPITGGQFKPEFDYHIEITLKPEFLPQLLAKAKTKEEAFNYLADLSENEPNSDLLNSENWLALSIKQNQKGKEVGYQTFWSYLPIESLKNPEINSEQLSQSLTNFMSELFESNLTEALQDFTKETLGDLSSIFKDIDKEETETSLFKTLINFFLEDDWTFTKIEGETSLKTGFRGENGQWNCYAMVKEDRQQLVFYSVYPVNIPEDKRLTIAEFITRANYGMIMGNFEMDFEDGEVRYKTSIDVEGDSLSFALIKRLIYSNVLTFDDYIPGIEAIINDNLSAKEAIIKVEE
jgi:hypothetical protein